MRLSVDRLRIERVDPDVADLRRRHDDELNQFDLSFLTPSSYSRSARVSFDLGLPLGDYAFPARRPSTDLCDAFGSRKRSIGLLGSPWRRTSSIDMGDPLPRALLMSNYVVGSSRGEV